MNLAVCGFLVVHHQVDSKTCLEISVNVIERWDVSVDFVGLSGFEAFYAAAEG
jgi:hypothetical protein